MKRLFYLSGTLFFLSLTLLVGIHIGQQQASAAPGQKVVGFSVDQSVVWVIDANADVYKFRSDLLGTNGYLPELVGNYWTGQ